MKSNIEYTWVGPFALRTLLEGCMNPSHPQPADSRSAYLVSRFPWRGVPRNESEVLYVGGNTGKSQRFRTRLGDLIIDALGFFAGDTGHSSGGQSLHRWCADNNVHPLDLQIAWIERAACHRCTEVDLYGHFEPRLNRKRPPRCPVH